MFPEAFPPNETLPVPRVEQTNKAYDGWFVQTDHLFFADGHRASFSLTDTLHRMWSTYLSTPTDVLCHFVWSLLLPAGDPWREATKAADGTHFPSTSEQPLAISDGFHCSDLITQNAVVDNTVLSVQKQALQSMKSWIAEWEPFTYVSGFGGF